MNIKKNIQHHISEQLKSPFVSKIYFCLNGFKYMEYDNVLTIYPHFCEW